MNDWSPLRHLTAARIGLDRTGPALATTPLLEFRLAQAAARDAVHAELDVATLRAALPTPAIVARSQAPDRRTYLMRPDLGRALDPATAAALMPHAAPPDAPYDLAIIVADGLSARAAERHAPALLDLLLPTLKSWRLAPLTVATQSRVALADHIALALNATAALILIGERPGLTAPDSLSAYLTYAPTPNTSDAARNCLSNIRPAGLPYPDAAQTLVYLLTRMRELRQSGVSLKDESRTPSLPRPTTPADTRNASCRNATSVRPR